MAKKQHSSVTRDRLSSTPPPPAAAAPLLSHTFHLFVLFPLYSSGCVNLLCFISVLKTNSTARWNKPNPDIYSEVSAICFSTYSVLNQWRCGLLPSCWVAQTLRLSPALVLRAATRKGQVESIVTELSALSWFMSSRLVMFVVPQPAHCFHIFVLYKGSERYDFDGKQPADRVLLSLHKWSRRTLQLMSVSSSVHLQLLLFISHLIILEIIVKMYVRISVTSPNVVFCSRNISTLKYISLTINLETPPTNAVLVYIHFFSRFHTMTFDHWNLISSSLSTSGNWSNCEEIPQRPIWDIMFKRPKTWPLTYDQTNLILSSLSLSEHLYWI